MYLISVIMPIYNSEYYLKRAINSVICQTIGFENIELVLIDDCSSDLSKEIIIEYSSKYSNIKAIFLDKNHGFPGHARNVGLKNSTSDYIMFLDSDDQYEHDYCKVVYDVMESYESDVALVNFKIIENSFSRNKDYFSRISDCSYIKNDLKLVKLDKFRRISSTALWSKIFKKSIIVNNNMNFVEDMLNEDSIFLYEYYYYANNLILIDYFGYKHYRHGNNVSYFSSKVTLEFIKSYYHILDLIKMEYGDDIDIEYLFKDKIQGTIFDIMFASDQKCLLEALYNFEQDINFNSSLDNFWSSFVNNLILKRKFFMAIFILKISKIFKILLDFLRRFKNH